MRVTIHKKSFSYIDLLRALTFWCTCKYNKVMDLSCLQQDDETEGCSLLFPYLFHSLTLGDIFIAHFDPGITQTFQQVGRVQAGQVCYFIGNWGGDNEHE